MERCSVQSPSHFGYSLLAQEGEFFIVTFYIVFSRMYNCRGRPACLPIVVSGFFGRTDVSAPTCGVFRVIVGADRRVCPLIIYRFFALLGMNNLRFFMRTRAVSVRLIQKNSRKVVSSRE